MPSYFHTERDGIAYDLMPEYRDSYADGIFMREQIALVNWDEKDDFLSAIMPDVTMDSGTSTETLQIGLYGGKAGQGQLASVPRVYLKRLNAQVHPNDDTMRVVDYEVLEGVGYPIKDPDGMFAFHTNSTGATQGACKIRVTWKTLPYRVDISDAAANANGASELSRYCSIKTDYAGQNLELTGTLLRKMRFDGLPTDGVATHFPRPYMTTLRKPFPEQHVKITWWMVPTIPQCISAYEGRVNTTAFTFTEPGTSRIYRANYRIGTMLFLTAEISDPYYTFNGNRVVNITYHFLRRDNQGGPRNFGLGHNFLFSPGDGQFYRACTPRALAGPPLTYYGPVNDAPWFPNQNVHDYVEMQNLWKIDGDTITYL